MALPQLDVNNNGVDQSGLLVKLAQTVGQFMGKNKLRTDETTGAYDPNTRQPIPGTQQYKEDWWDSMFGNRGQNMNKQVQLDQLGRDREMDTDAEIRSRDVADIRRRGDMNRNESTENIRRGGINEEVTARGEGGSTARQKLYNLGEELDNTGKKLGTEKDRIKVDANRANVELNEFNRPSYATTVQAGQQTAANAAKAQQAKSTVDKLLSESTATSESSPGAELQRQIAAGSAILARTAGANNAATSAQQQGEILNNPGYLNNLKIGSTAQALRPQIENEVEMMRGRAAENTGKAHLQSTARQPIEARPIEITPGNAIITNRETGEGFRLDANPRNGIIHMPPAFIPASKSTATPESRQGSPTSSAAEDWKKVTSRKMPLTPRSLLDIKQ